MRVTDGDASNLYAARCSLNLGFRLDAPGFKVADAGLAVFAGEAQQGRDFRGHDPARLTVELGGSASFFVVNVRALDGEKFWMSIFLFCHIEFY